MTDAGPEPAKDGGAAGAAPSDPRHCFICLSDETDDAAPQEWVTPCPCTLEGHQECMLTWVASREGDRRRLECPVCKAPIKVSGPWNPVAALNEYWNSTVLGVAPWVLAGTTVAGVYAANFAHGIHSLATFAGPEAARATVYTRWPAAGVRDLRWSAAAAVAHLTPALVVLRLVPGLGIRTLPSLGATAIGFYKLAHPDFSLRRWPPSPWAALFFVICVRSAYFRLWKKWFYDWERRIDRRLDNLPDEPEPAPDRPAARVAVRNGGGGAGIIGWILERVVLGLDVDVELEEDAREARRRRRQERRRIRAAREARNARQHRVPLQPHQGRLDDDDDAQLDARDVINRMNALNARMDRQFRARVQEMRRQNEQGAGADAAGEVANAEVVAAQDPGNDANDQQELDNAINQLHIDLGAADDEDDDDEEDANMMGQFEVMEQGPAGENDNEALIVADLMAENIRNNAMLPVEDDDDDDINIPVAANANPANADPNDMPDPAPAADAAAAPAPRAGNVGLTIDRIIVETTISFLFPMICYSFGELLRLTVLPRSWTEASSGGVPWARRPDGLLNKRWGRSLLGGCVFVVLRDAVRMYAKYSTLRDRAFKKVISVDRTRARA